MYCPKCYRQIPDDSKFCPSCGADVSVPVCIGCGNPIRRGDKFCNHCGIPISTEVKMPDSTVNWTWDREYAPNSQKEQTWEEYFQLKSQREKMEASKRAKILLVVLGVIFMFFLFVGGDTSFTDKNSQSTDSAVESSILSPILYSKNGVRITANNIVQNRNSTEINILVENDTADNITLYCTTFIVNGAMIDTLAYINVAAGAKANSSIYFDEDDLSAAGIGQIVTVKSYDAHISFPDSSKDTEYISLEVTTSKANSYTQTFDESGKILYNQNGITVISKMSPGLDTNRIPLLIKNDSGKDFNVWTNNVTVNGYTIPEWHYNTIVCDGTVRYFDIHLTNDGLTANKIQSINTVSFSIDFLKPKSSRVIWETGELEIS